MLLNAAKFQGCSFYHFLVIKGKPTWGVGKITPLPHTPRLGLINELIKMYAYTKQTQSSKSTEAVQKKPPSTSESSKTAEIKTPLL